MLCDILLKQRKMYFDSFINFDAIDKMNNLSNENDKVSQKKQNIGKKNALRYRRNKIISSFEYGKISPDSVSKIFMSPKIINAIKNNPIEKKKYKFNFVNKEKKSEGIDQILCGINRFVTLSEKRMEKQLEFKKKYKEKILENAKKLRKLRIKEMLPENEDIKGRNKNTSFSNFQKSNTLYGKLYQYLPLLNNNENKKYDNEYELIVPYENPLLMKSTSTSEINPLSYDDFNRSFNTSQYFNIDGNESNSGRSGSLENKSNRLEYTLKLKSDIKLIKKPNHFIKKDVLIQRLRNIYKDKFEKILFDNNKKSN
jgi:hypothetical protein